MSKIEKAQRELDVKNLARLAATLWDEEKAGEWVYITDKNDVYGVVLLLKELGLDITSSVLDELLEKIEANKKRTD
jgi:hypothetical protein